MQLCLFEDRAESFEPLTLTRPVFDLICGVTTLGDKQRRLLPGAKCGMLVRPALEALCRQSRPDDAVNDMAWLQAAPTLLVNGRWLPSEPSIALSPPPCLGVVNGQVAYALLTPAELKSLTSENTAAQLDALQADLQCWQASGTLVNYAWELVDRNGEQILREFKETARNGRLTANAGAVLGPPEGMWVHATARVEPMVVADATRGPVIIDRGAVVHAFSRLEGPCYVGPQAQVFGAKIRAGTTLGPQCRIGGEVEASIVHGHSNKYHDGFLGHSYVGEWVNLGAGTHNSDLRNDYGEVTMTVGGLRIRTGLTKVGCFIGDHTKTGLGTLFNTGSNVGAFCNVLPTAGYAPKHVPSFTSWWNGALREAFTLEQMLTTAERAMQRRGVALTETHRELYTGLFHETAALRRRVMRESEQRALRRSA